MGQTIKMDFKIWINNQAFNVWVVAYSMATCGKQSRYDQERWDQVGFLRAFDSTFIFKQWKIT